MPIKNRIVFLDRDGVINKHRKNYVKKISEFEIISGVGKNLAKLSENGFKLIVITNQSVINRKLTEEIELKKIHEFMIEKLRKDGCVINQIYYCPHIPEENCDCRKPKTLLFKKALVEFSPCDLKNSWMIGDSVSDMEAAYSLGIKGIKVNSNQDIRIVINEILSSQQ